MGCNTFAAATVGVGIRVPVNKGTLFRGETMIRSRPTYNYTAFGANFGLTWLTGASRGPALADDDGDGVPNNQDHCPNTPHGALVDRHGCPTDFDGDGVPDGIDRCPATPKGTPVDQYGCPIMRPQ